LSNDGDFCYLGGATPIPPHLDARARRIALQALDAFPELTGYVGVDLVLGKDAAGREDVVIEINPRLTTSYVGLRRITDVNLAGVMMAIAEGKHAEVCVTSQTVAFHADGRIE
jgi:predicted ATP-grasp superfamily ATP-dependent carboligase